MHCALFERCQAEMAERLHEIRDRRMREQGYVPEHVMEDVGLLEIIELIGGADEIPGRHAGSAIPGRRLRRARSLHWPVVWSFRVFLHEQEKTPPVGPGGVRMAWRFLARVSPIPPGRCRNKNRDRPRPRREARR